MSENKPLPLAVQGVAWLFIVLGLVAAYETAMNAMAGQNRIQLNMILLACGIGLYQRTNFWRITGILAALGMLFLHGFLAIFLMINTEVAESMDFLIAGFHVVLLVVVYLILTHPPYRVWFGPDAPDDDRDASAPSDY